MSAHPAPAPSAETAMHERALERARRYLAALGLSAARTEALLAELRERLSHSAPRGEAAVLARMYDLLHRLLADHRSTHGTVVPSDAASLPARVAARFASMRVPELNGWPRLPSMPPIARGHMRPPALDRNPFRRVADVCRGMGPAAARWLRQLNPMRAEALARQWLLLLLVAVPALGATSYLAAVLPHKGSTALELAILAAGFLLFGWILVGFWTAVAGFWVLLFGDRYSMRPRDAADTPLPDDARTAVVMPVCDEEVARVFAGLRTVYASLAETGEGDGFDFFVLSDTRDPDLWIAEETAWAEACEALGAHGRLFYRRRRTHAKRKNGNIADFCRRWGGQYRYMVVLDADSIMTGGALTSLVRMMERRPEAGLIQTQPIAVNRISPIARVQQFALRAYGPLFAAGLHFWHVDNAHYWGHNAVIRVAPFMAHCSLPRLPAWRKEGSDILSHDFVEAALMRRAGWGVYLAYELGGSYEEMPPTLLDELKRDRRWCQGNFQHLRLLFSDRLNPAHRALFANGVMAYASALLWLIFLGLSSAEVVVEALRPPDYFPQPGALFPEWPVWRPEWALSLFACTMIVLFMPKILGLCHILVRGEGRAFGGWPRLVASALGEIAFTMLVAPIRMLSHSRFVLVTLLGGSVRWGSQPRSDKGVPWPRALRYHGPGMLLAAAWGGAILWIAPGFAGWLAPVLLPLLIAPAITVVSSRPGLGRWLRRRRLFLIPEESRPPRVLRRLRRMTGRAAGAPAADFESAAVDPAINALHCALVRHSGRLAPPIRAHREELIGRAVSDGPPALSTAEKAELLADGDSTRRLHAALWSAPQGPGPMARTGGDRDTAFLRQ